MSGKRAQKTSKKQQKKPLRRTSVYEVPQRGSTTYIFTGHTVSGKAQKTFLFCVRIHSKGIKTLCYQKGIAVPYGVHEELIDKGVIQDVCLIFRKTEAKA